MNSSGGISPVRRNARSFNTSGAGSGSSNASGSPLVSSGTSAHSASSSPSSFSSASRWVAITAIVFIIALGANVYIFQSNGSRQSPQTSSSSSDIQHVSHPVAFGEAESATLVSQKWVAMQAAQFLAPGSGRNLSYGEMDQNPFNLPRDLTIWDAYFADISCPDIERIGRIGDGGKFICGLTFLREKSRAQVASKSAGPPCVAYSFGISMDSSFEQALHRAAHCEVHGFDPSIGKLPPQADDIPQGAIQFHKIALWPHTGSGGNFALTAHLRDIMRELNHSYIDVLKIDVESSEWVVFDDLFHRFEGGLDFFGQLLIEVHYKSVAAMDNFFKGMRRSGFVTYSRELNILPCLRGGLPIASEFSFINPSLFYSQGKSKSVSTALMAPSRQSVENPRWMRTINGVIYFLTHKKRVPSMIQVLKSLYSTLWKYYPNYPVVIFHDNLDSESESLLQSAVPKMPLEFQLIKFELPPGYVLNQSTTHLNLRSQKERVVVVPRRTRCTPMTSTIGYRHMIHFHATIVHKHLMKRKFPNGKPLEYIFRLDDDSYLTHPVGYDIFRMMDINNKKYGFVNTMIDDPVCIEGMWDHARAFLKSFNQSNPGIVRKENFLEQLENGQIFYNNFELSHVDVWTHPLWRAYIGDIERSGKIFLERWGDAPIHTLAVSMIFGLNEIHRFSDIGYRHDPFVRQLPAGLPKPDMNPLREDDLTCVFYDQWVCTPRHLSGNSSNATNATFGWDVTALQSPAWARPPTDETEVLDEEATSSSSSSTEVAEIPAEDAKHKGVLFTFAGAGHENLVADTIMSYYNNYARVYRVPFVVFYEPNPAPVEINGSGVVKLKFNPNRLKSLLPVNVARTVTLLPVDIYGTSKSRRECKGIRDRDCFDPEDGTYLDKDIFTSPSHNLFWKTQLSRTSLTRPPLSCLDFRSSEISAFYLYRASHILKQKGYEWLWRFSMSSRLQKPVTYDVFKKMSSSGKRYGFLSSYRENSTCIHGLWQTALDLCKLRKSSDCSGLINKWPRNLVVFSHFEISHVSLWESSIVLDFFRTLFWQQGQYEIEALTKSSSIVRSTGITWWKESTVRTLAVLISLTSREILRITDIQQEADLRVTAVITGPDEARGVVHSTKDLLETSLTRKLPGSPIASLDSFFRPQRFGWMGGDVATSFALPDWNYVFRALRSDSPKELEPHPQDETNSFIWLFGDTYIGTSDNIRRLEGVMISNSIGVASMDNSAVLPERRLRHMQYYWGVNDDGLPTAALKRPLPQRSALASKRIAVSPSFWPMAGISLVKQSSTSKMDCFVAIVGQFVVAERQDSFDSNLAPDINELVGGDASLQFSVSQMAVALVSNPHSPPSMWAYEWLLFPRYSAARLAGGTKCSETITYDWFAVGHAGAHSSFAVEADYVVFVGTYYRKAPDATGENSHDASSGKNDIFGYLTLQQYNVIGRILASDLLASQLETMEVLFPTADPSGSSRWRRIYKKVPSQSEGAGAGDKKISSYLDVIETDLDPVRVFPYQGYTTEGNLVFDSASQQWTFVTLKPFENMILICTLPQKTLEGSWSCAFSSEMEARWKDVNAYVTYAGKIHPELTAAGNRSSRAVISYVPNTLAGPGDMFLRKHRLAYAPKFVNIELR